MAVLLEARAVTKKFGGLTALNAVDFDLDRDHDLDRDLDLDLDRDRDDDPFPGRHVLAVPVVLATQPYQNNSLSTPSSISPWVITKEG